MKNFEETRQIITDEIKKHKTIGFVKDNTLLYMDVENNSNIYKPFKFVALFSGLILLLIVKIDFLSKYIANYEVYVFSAPIVIMLLIFFIGALCKNFLIYDFKKNCFYTLSNLFGRIPLPFLNTKSIDSNKIKKIILETKYEYTGSNRTLNEKIIVLTSDNKEIELTEIMSTGQYHDILMARCDLFSRIFNVDFAVRGELKEVENDKKLVLERNENLILLLIIIVVANRQYFF